MKTSLRFPRHRPAFVALACLLPLLPTAVHAQLVDIEWRNGVASHEFQVEPGKFGEWCGKLQHGQRVAWRFESTQPTDFNIHYHEGKKVRYPARHAAVSAKAATLKIPLDQDYCWMWTNKSAQAVTVRASLQTQP